MWSHIYQMALVYWVSWPWRIGQTQTVCYMLLNVTNYYFPESLIVKCLAQEQIMSLARCPTQTTRSRFKRTNRETTVPPMHCTFRLLLIVPNYQLGKNKSRAVPDDISPSISSKGCCCLFQDWLKWILFLTKFFVSRIQGWLVQWLQFVQWVTHHQKVSRVTC